MPIYDYKCDQCGTVTETIRRSNVFAITCPACKEDPNPVNQRYGQGWAYRLLSAPASFRFPDMATVNKKRQRVKEPRWLYPDEIGRASCRERVFGLV